MVHGIAFLEAEETGTKLDGAVDIRGRQRETLQAERVGRIGLLGRNDAAARPLVVSVTAGERNSAKLKSMSISWEAISMTTANM